MYLTVPATCTNTHYQIKQNIKSQQHTTDNHCYTSQRTEMDATLLQLLDTFIWTSRHGWQNGIQKDRIWILNIDVLNWCLHVSAPNHQQLGLLETKRCHTVDNSCISQMQVQQTKISYWTRVNDWLTQVQLSLLGANILGSESSC